jgi:hypothetical protein
MGEMVIISMTIVAVVLIAGISLNGIVDKVMSTKRQRIEARGMPGTDVREIAERQQMIEDRLLVLERIATDRGTLLAGEIEALRDETRAITRVKDTAQ